MRSPERQGRYPDDAASSGHHGPCPSSLSAGKSTFRPKKPPLIGASPTSAREEDVIAVQQNGGVIPARSRRDWKAPGGGENCAMETYGLRSVPDRVRRYPLHRLT